MKKQFTAHMEKLNVLPGDQSPYREFHLTETALCCIVSDLLEYTDKDKCVILILFDPSAAFDTIDHALLMEDLCDAEVFVNRIVENKEAFFVMTGNRTMDTLLRDTNRQKFAKRGLEIQYPPEHEAARTVLIRNVDSTISALNEQEIRNYIDKDLNVKQVIKIPNSEHLLKIVFNSTEDAEKVVWDGLVIKFQRFQNRNIEKEVFIPVVPCYRCYSYEHQKRNCSKSAQYKICSNCARKATSIVNVRKRLLNALTAAKTTAHWHQSAL